jgi:hypothetical protein
VGVSVPGDATVGVDIESGRGVNVLDGTGVGVAATNKVAVAAGAGVRVRSWACVEARRVAGVDRVAAVVKVWSPHETSNNPSTRHKVLLNRDRSTHSPPDL